ncbi:hypothetical protein O7626_40310 [Micromonospora sp. WMMD1102]|uniref:hypothetical protein n=1 Tax=Micromonospora sp. WMMD1102 TaxID=3016105 RepID=UPI002415928D|nr:hypothetical protein [Micromonospora sp. WMMD1102]MDG4792062.1 hypothetical protein [Micromonospora sp. WMMD1102]
MARTKKATYCGDCCAEFGPNVQPGRTSGICDVCSPLHVVHLALAGDFATYCGAMMHEVRADDAQDVVFDEVTSAINCQRCLDAHSNRSSY